MNGYTESGEGASITASVTVESRVNLYLNAVYTPAEGADVKFTLTNPEDGSLICHLLTNVKDGVMCQASYVQVGAKEMRRPISITLYDGETAVSKTITWSVESYVAQVREDANSSAEKIAMVNAMLTYGDAVAAYMTSIGN